jgi:hypothetical protein
MSTYYWKGPFLMRAAEGREDGPAYIGHYEWDKNIQEYRIILYRSASAQVSQDRWEHFVTLPADDADTIREAARVLIITAYEELRK